jgi:hypothetical protein
MTSCLELGKTVLHNIDHNDPGETYTEIEVPIRGPGALTTLVTISGIAIVEMDVCSETTGADLRKLYQFRLFVETKYRFDVATDFRGGSAYAWLSSFQDDDYDLPNSVAINAVAVKLNSNNRVELLIEGDLHGDIAVERIGYQLYVLSAKPRPAPRLLPGRPRTERDLLDAGIRVGDFLPHG